MDQTELTPSVDHFYQYISKGQLQITECGECKARYGAPKVVCPKCLSKNLHFSPSKGVGKITSYTVIHVPHPDFQDKIPYIIGVVQLDEGPRLLSLISDLKPEDVKTGQRVKFYSEQGEASSVPPWGRYAFRPA